VRSGQKREREKREVRVEAKGSPRRGCIGMERDENTSALYEGAASEPTVNALSVKISWPALDDRDEFHPARS